MALTKVSRGLLSTSIEDNGNATAITIDSSENVGIGTSSPSTALDVVGTATMDGLTVDGAYTDVKFKTTQGRLDLWLTDTDTTEGQVRVRGDANNLVFITNTAERMRIDSSGNLRLTGTAPSSEDNISTINFFNTSSGLNLASIEGKRTAGGTNYGSLIFNTTSSGTSAERMRIDSSGRVLLNKTAATSSLTLESQAPSGFSIGSGFYSSATGSTIEFKDSNTTANYKVRIGAYTDDMVMFAGGSERMRIDSSGNLLVGVTTNSSSVAGVTAGNSGLITACRSSNYSGIFNRLSTDGDIVQFRKDGSTVGSINSVSGDSIAIGTGDTGLRFSDTIKKIHPYDINSGTNSDNVLDLGDSNKRFDDIYATNGTIQTSDRNEKQDIAELSEAEQRVAVAAKGLLRKFRWKDSVAEKGDEARIHFGIIAQDLQAAFEAEGLDAGDYAMFISTTWTDEETNEEKTRMGVRYSELLAFIISAI